MPGLSKRCGGRILAALAATLFASATSRSLADEPASQPAEQAADDRYSANDISALRAEVRSLRAEVSRLQESFGSRPTRRKSLQISLRHHPNPGYESRRTQTLARTYSVADLVFAVPDQAAAQADSLAGHADAGTQTDFASLEELITSNIEPKSWKQAGGQGTIERFPRNLSLVITQTAEIHEQIADLFEQLRRAAELQVSLRCYLITLPAKASLNIELPAAGTKRMPAHESSAIVEQAQADKQTSLFSLPTVTIWPAQVANFKWSPAESQEAEALIHAAVAADRRSARLSVAVNASDAMDALRSSTSLDVPDGETLIVDITDRLRPPAQGERLSLAARLRAAGAGTVVSSENAVRTLLLVTPVIIAPEEEEALLKVVERAVPASR